MIICTKVHGFFYLSFLGSDGYLFQLHTGKSDQNCLIETVQVLKVIVFNCFHDNLHKSAWIVLL